MRWILAAIAVLLLQAWLLNDMGGYAVCALVLLLFIAQWQLIMKMKQGGPVVPIGPTAVIALAGLCISQTVIFLPVYIHYIDWQFGIKALGTLSNTISLFLIGISKIVPAASQAGPEYAARAIVIRDTHMMAQTLALLAGLAVLFTPMPTGSSHWRHLMKFSTDIQKEFRWKFFKYVLWLWPIMFLLWFFNEPLLLSGTSTRVRQWQPVLLTDSNLHWSAWIEAVLMVFMGPMLLKVAIVTRFKRLDGVTQAETVTTNSNR